MNLKQAVSNAKIFLSNNSPVILTAMGVVGTVTTAIMASQATIKAQDILYDNGAEDLPWQDKARLTWKCYIPTGLMGITTVGAIVGSHVCSENQKAAIQSAYLLSQTTLQEYQKRVVERIGKNKERQVYEETVQAIADKQAPMELYSSGDLPDRVYETGHGNSLFYDVPGERYFKSEINYLRTKFNDLNTRVRTEMYFDWNDLYYAIDLPRKPMDGTEMIFDVDRPFSWSFTPQLMENGQVRILWDYELYPKSTYRLRG